MQSPYFAPLHLDQDQPTPHPNSTSGLFLELRLLTPYFVILPCVRATGNKAIADFQTRVGLRGSAVSEQMNTYDWSPKPEEHADLKIF